ncbi:hypothetical protein [Phormidium sp. FACHB-1136]|uniref:hypothetical protein n=1 Tax=Phormidium sp. FACHB-1136 TaxID=2692848 RepID=UPI001683A45F|nr:hypothetical protein [Phormidium sp. FACHB-1136]MBD2425556.1 hypothetical protein [Phormidium sp. FACHB-1136]
MTHASQSVARVQYSSRQALDVAVIRYCRGQSRYDLHARMRSALNSCYGPFAMAATQAPPQDIRRQAMRSIQQLTDQIREIQSRFLPEFDALAHPVPLPTVAPQRTGPPHPQMPSPQGTPTTSLIEQPQSFPEPGPVDPSLRDFLGDDAAIMAGLNPFIHDLT